jgi:hypothetical protein
MHIVSSFYKYTLYPLLSNISTSQINTLYPLHRNTHYMHYSEMHILYYFKPYYKLYYKNAHYILFQENTLYPHHRNTHIHFSDKHNKSFSADKHNMSFSQIYIFTDRHTISSIYSLHRNTHNFSEKTLYFLHINAQYILFTELNTTTSSLKNTLYPPYHYI